jgi:excisionase family DNA binding protein
VADKIVLSRREAAEALGISLDTLAALIANGELRALRIGKAVRVPREEIEGLIRRGRAQTRGRSVTNDDAVNHLAGGALVPRKPETKMLPDERMDEADSDAQR